MIFLGERGSHGRAFRPAERFFGGPHYTDWAAQIYFTDPERLDTTDVASDEIINDYDADLVDLVFRLETNSE